MRPTSLWICGGLDPTGGAGVLRDLWTARSFAPELAAAATVSAWTEQGHGAPAVAVARPLAAIVADLQGFARPAAIKLGLTPTTLVDEGLAAAIQGLADGAPIVVDPVLAASDGGDLGASVDGLLRLGAAATLFTPNGLEAAALAGAVDPASWIPRLRERLGDAVAILIKGGHTARDEAADTVVDVLIDREGTVEFRRPRRPGADPRGTGCALATAIACGLARGAPLRPSIAAAIAWLDDARTRCHLGPDGRPHLPLADAPRGGAGDPA
ncbi:MAG: bifunctional hydroxymethylpyrimidine kinase/phosphomethylpyrimidine kinase [Nannocystaceae bacterium]